MLFSLYISAKQCMWQIVMFFFLLYLVQIADVRLEVGVDPETPNMPTFFNRLTSEDFVNFLFYTFNGTTPSSSYFVVPTACNKWTIIIKWKEHYLLPYYFLLNVLSWWCNCATEEYIFGCGFVINDEFDCACAYGCRQFMCSARQDEVDSSGCSNFARVLGCCIPT